MNYMIALCVALVVVPQILLASPPVASNTFCVEKTDGTYANSFHCGYYYECKRSATKLRRCNEGYQFDYLSLSCIAAEESTCLRSARSECVVDCSGHNHGDLFPNPEDCGSFYQCSWGTAYLHQCPRGLLFNPAINVCDWPGNVDCQLGMHCDWGTTTQNPTSTQRPTTQDPTTQNPTSTQRPTTQNPTSTQRPTTQKPTTTQRPTTEKPTTTQRPTTQKPTTTQRPTTEKPTTTQRPTTQKPTTTQRPTTQKPTTTQRPTTQKPTTTQRPTTQKPTTTQRPTTKRTTKPPKSSEESDSTSSEESREVFELESSNVKHNNIIEAVGKPKIQKFFW